RRWWGTALVILVGLTPELYCLYAQFDAHPDKLVFGQTGVSGLRFFFWDSQFGRFLNTGPIRGHGTPWFFLHTTLWAFWPWSGVLALALVPRLTPHGRPAPPPRGPRRPPRPSGIRAPVPSSRSWCCRRRSFSCRTISRSSFRFGPFSRLSTWRR